MTIEMARYQDWDAKKPSNELECQSAHQTKLQLLMASHQRRKACLTQSCAIKRSRVILKCCSRRRRKTQLTWIKKSSPSISTTTWENRCPRITSIPPLRRTSWVPATTRRSFCKVRSALNLPVRWWNARRVSTPFLTSSRRNERWSETPRTSKLALEITSLSCLGHATM